MRALVFNGELSLTERPTPKREDESLVRVRLAGICNTDIEITRGYNAYHGILGHETVPEILDLAGDDRLRFLRFFTPQLAIRVGDLLQVIDVVQIGAVDLSDGRIEVPRH